MIEQNKDSKIILNVFDRLARLGRELREREKHKELSNSRESCHSHGQVAENIASKGQFTANE